MRSVHIAVLIMSIAAPACSESDKSPAAPTTSGTTVNAAGVWNYTATLTGYTGGECVGSLVQASIGWVDRGTMSITQNGSVLSATVRSTETEMSCTYSGTASGSSISLTSASCDVTTFTLACVNGAVRDVRLQSYGINATITDRSGTGTYMERWNVFASGAQTGLGLLTVNSSFSATRQ